MATADGETRGHLVCLNSCIRTAASVCTCVVPMRFQSVMDRGQVGKHGTPAETGRGDDSQTEGANKRERERERERQRGAGLTDESCISQIEQDPMGDN